MEEETPPLPDLEQFRDIRGLDCPPSPMCCPRRSMRREENKETYKLPHRLIEKKRRDRINECIAQLKDLLPEHLKLTTLGHLEKAVVLELTLKHVKTLTALTEQQHQKIIALQNGDRPLTSPLQSADLEAFHSGFQMCTKEVLHYLSPPESWGNWEPHCAQLLGHLHSACRRFLSGSPLLTPKLGTGAEGQSFSLQDGPQQLLPDQHPGETLKQEPPQPHCVPVIQRTQNWGRGAATPQLPPSGPEQTGEPDTDTDSGYGGEGEGKKTPQGGLRVKREPAGDGQEGGGSEGGKRRRLENCTGQGAGAALLNPLVALGVGATGALGGSLLGQTAHAAPFYLPFYFVGPSAAYLQPFLEKALCPSGGPAGSFPFIHPGSPIQGPPAALPSLTVAAPAEKGSLLLGAAPRFPREGAPHHSDPSSAFSPPPPCKPAGLNPEDPCPSPKLNLQPRKEKELEGTLKVI